MTASPVCLCFPEAGEGEGEACRPGGLARATGIQLSVFGIDYDHQRLNIDLVAWTIIFLLLVYYAWVRR